MLPGEEDEEVDGDFVSPNRKKRSTRSVKPRKSTSNKYDCILVSLIMIFCLSYEMVL